VKSFGDTLEKIQSDLIDAQDKYENDEDDEGVGDSRNYIKNQKFDLSQYYKTFLRHKRGR
jgi:hypothetical protein